jgi:hypothetical protein
MRCSLTAFHGFRFAAKDETMKRFLSAAMALAILPFGIARPASADWFSAHCFGAAIVYQGDSVANISNPLIDFGSLASYGQQYGHDKDCADKVSAAAASNGNFNDKNWLCQHIQQRGQFRVAAYAKVGTQNYRIAQSIFVTCTGGVRTCTCPKGWTSNGDTQSDGGIATDGKCKKLACNGNMVSPFPPDGTQIGNWGFTWGNSFIAWGTTANGGAAHCVTSPWEGH